MLVAIVIVAALGGLCYVVYNSFTKLKIKEERNGIKSQMVFLKEQWEEADKYRRICGEKVRDPAYESCRRSFDAIRDFIMEEQLPDEVQEVLELKSVVDIENMEKFFADMESLREDSFGSCVHIAELGKKYNLDVEALPGEKVHDKYLEIQGDVQSSEKSNRILVRRMKDVHGGIGELATVFAFIPLILLLSSIFAITMKATNITASITRINICFSFKNLTSPIIFFFLYF